MSCVMRKLALCLYKKPQCQSDCTTVQSDQCIYYSLSNWHKISEQKNAKDRFTAFPITLSYKFS